MNTFVVLAAILGCAFGNPQVSLGYPYFGGALGYSGVGPAISYTSGPAISYSSGPAVTYAAPAITYATAPAVIAPAFTKTQYHAQDELGQASFGHAEPGQAHSAVRDAFGNVRGAYAYINPEGKEIRVAYTAGHGGVNVESNALPVAPVHIVDPLVGPVPVDDTPEVIEARTAHLQAVEEAKARNAAAEPDESETRTERKKRGILAAAPISTLTYATGFTKYAAVPYASSHSYRYDAPRRNVVLVPHAPLVAPAPVAVKAVSYVAPAALPLKTVSYAVAAPKVLTYAPAVRTYSSYYSPAFGSSLYRYSPYSALGYGYGYSRFY